MSQSIHKILITGYAKSGTTALFFRLQNSFGQAVKTFFEPASASELVNTLAGQNNIIAKVILPLPEQLSDSLDLFTHRILLLRDPRDIVISALLYSGYEILYRYDDTKLEQCLELLKQKESNPSSVSFLTLLTAFHIGLSTDEYAAALRGLISPFHAMAGDKRFYPFRYEHLVEDHTDDLSRYLGFPISTNDQIGQKYSRVSRTKASGSWKNWFTEEDIIFFKPLFCDFLQTFGYGQDWTINPCPEIPAEHASLYVRKIVNERRKQEGMVLISQ